MKRLLTTLLIVTSCLTTYGQSTYKINGYVLDSLQQGIELASVVLLQAQDSVMAGFSITNKDGKFQIEDVEPGSYLINASFLGYRDHNKEIEIAGDNNEISLGNIMMSEASSLMDEVTISTTHVPIKIKKDTIEYNSAAFKTQANDAVEELLKKLPGIEVESDGTIKAHGEEVERVLVEGKEFFSNDPTVATKNLPANAVDKVQVFDKLSEMAEFSGIDDGERMKTINLALKDDMKAGYFGNATAGGGTDSRYEGKFNINRFTPKLQVSTIGMLNNTNKQGFSFRDYISFMGGLGSLMSGGGRGSDGIPISDGLGNGFVKTYAGGANFNYELGSRSDFNVSYFYNNINNQIDKIVLRENISNQIGFVTDVNSQQENANSAHNINARLKQEIDSTQNFTMNLRFGLNDGNSMITSNTQNFTAASVLQSAALQENSSIGDKVSFNSDLTYRKKLRKKGRFLTTSLAYGMNNSDQSAILNSVNKLNRRNTLEVDTVLQDQFNINEQNNYRLRVSFTEPLGGRKYLELNASRRNFKNDFDKEFYDLFPGEMPSEILNYQLSNSYIRDFSYNQVGANFKVNKNDLSLTTGITLQYSDLKGTIINNEQEINQNYFNILPSLNLQYDISQMSNLRVRYRTSVNEPSLEQLQPIVDNSNPLNIYIGNPDLDPEYRHTLRINYNTFSQFSNTGFFAFVNARYSTNTITNTKTIDEFLVQTTRPVNVDNDLNLSSNLNYNMPIKFLKQRLTVGTNITYRKSILFINELQDNTTRINNGVRISLNNLYTDKLDITYGTNLGYNSTKYSESSELNQNYINQNYFVDFNYDFPEDWTFSTDIDHTIFSQETFGDEESLTNFNASISKVFLKSKKARFELGVTDILNQNQNINRSSNLNFIQDSRILSLGRYYMLSLSYSFSGFGQQGGGFGRGGGGGRGRGRSRG